MQLPLIDISSWADLCNESADSPPDLCSKSESTLKLLNQVVEEWNYCMETYGFALIRGHRIKTQVIRNIEKDANAFFSQSMDMKMRYWRGYYGHPLGGYTPPGIESVALSNFDVDKANPDPVENFVYCFDPKEFAVDDEGTCERLGSPMSSAEDYYHQLEQLLRVLHRLSAYSLGLNDLDFFNKFYFDRIERESHITPRDGGDRVINGNSLRLSHYFPPSDGSIDNETLQREQIQYGSHTDYQGFTILRPDPSDWSEDGGRGLQVQNPINMEWFPVKIPQTSTVIEEEIFVVNAGDLIQRWTNDRWLSVNHRVLGPVRGSPAAMRTRLAIVFFTGPYEDVMIETMPLLSSRTGSNQVNYKPILCGDHLRSKLLRSNIES